MLKERLAVGRTVVSHLADAERTNDLALIATARLAIVMLEGRLAIDAAAEIGHDAFEAVVETFSNQTVGRRQLVAAHTALLDAKRAVGMEDWDIGGSGNKKVPTGGLAVVRHARAA